ncbi:hypothetical protein F4861DRAFT_244106 [Xylaria intraflava]|nr:hypothetical protein F4861DRAFT_244106 [Xylaria intraflava]
MGKWGPGLLQSDDDADIAADLATMFGFPLGPPFSSPASSTSPPAFDHAATAVKLNAGNLLHHKFAKIMEPTFVPLTSHHTRERIAIVLGMLAAQTGAVLSSEHLVALRMLRPTLPTIEQQVQLVTMLYEYANDGATPWISGSKTLAETMQSSNNDRDTMDLFWYSGLGHSANQPPTFVMQSDVCMFCGDNEEDLFACNRCKIARYCGKRCQKLEWPSHKTVCVPREKAPSCVS